MPDVGSLIESAQARGLRLFLAGGKVKVQAPQALDGDTKALIEELKEHREEIKALLSQVGCPCWNCGQPMSEARTIFGDGVWVCWWCAKTA